MSSDEYLYACVEAGVALAGFSALAVAIRTRGDREFGVFERSLVASMIERGLVAAFFALLPMLVRSFLAAPLATWQVASGAICLYSATSVFRGAVRGRDLRVDELVGRGAFRVLLVAGVTFGFAPLLNILPFGVAQGAHWYLLAVTWQLCSSAYLFWFLIREWARAA